jgi:hypothetical protein
MCFVFCCQQFCVGKDAGKQVIFVRGKLNENQPLEQRIRIDIVSKDHLKDATGAQVNQFEFRHMEFVLSQ